MFARTFGETGYEVSRLGFGVMRLPVAEGGGVDFEKSTRILRLGFERGVSFFDSHQNYHNGQSEEAIGRALEGLPRESYIIQTKIGMYNGYTQGECRRLLEQALEKLKTDYIDFYLTHSLRRGDFEKHNDLFLEFTKRAMDEGLVRRIGFSSHDSPENIKEYIETGLFSAMLVQYNYLNRNNEGIIRLAAERGLGVSVMGPVGGGMLVPGWERRREEYPGDYSSPAELALRFVFANEGVDTALSGMSTAEQVIENTAVAASGKSLSPAQKKEIEEHFERKKKLLDLFCTGCGYCMPCPSGVNIRRIFEILNMKKVYGLDDEAARRYSRLEEGERASACAGCAECEDKCPQGIRVAGKLKEAARTFESGG